MRILKLISALLSYPTQALLDAVPELEQAVREDRSLPLHERERLFDFLETLEDADIWTLQAAYVEQFDRGRKFSLHLFEHVHGESRDRGQAMVDLLTVYQRHGFELKARELPDYLPLFLEFLASLPDAEARELLDQAMHVVALLGERLSAQHSPYHVLFDALLALGTTPQTLDAIREQVAGEGPDRSITEMDKIWEEEQVTFLASGPGGCGASQPAQQTVHFVRRPQAAAPL